MTTNRRMIQKAAKSAVGIAVGTTIGGCVLPRLFWSGLYNDTWPPVWQQALVYFAVGYIVAFLICLLANWIRQKRNPDKQP